MHDHRREMELFEVNFSASAQRLPNAPVACRSPRHPSTYYGRVDKAQTINPLLIDSPEGLIKCSPCNCSAPVEKINEVLNPLSLSPQVRFQIWVCQGSETAQLCNVLASLVSDKVPTRA